MPAMQNTLPQYCLLNNLGVIKVSGEAEKFLQGQLTNDMRKLSPTQASLSAYCDLKGRILTSLIVFKYHETHYLILNQDLIPLLMKELGKYAPFSKAKLTDESTNWQLLGVLGSLETSHFPENNTPSFAMHSDPNNIYIKMPGVNPRFILLTSPQNQLLQNSINTTELNKWQLEDINAGIVFVNTETTGLFTPHDLNYPQLGAVSFDKGCYRGQEIIARMQYLGKLKQHLQKAFVQTQNPPQLAAQLFSPQGQNAGQIAYVVNANERYAMLALVQDALVTTGQIFLDPTAKISVVIEKDII